MIRTCVAGVFLLLLGTRAFADADCEKRIKATGLYFLPSDPKRACEDNPGRETQDCIVDLLSRAKDKLRNQEFAEVYALCRTDPSKKTRDCVVKGLDKKWNETGYKGVRKVSRGCLLARPRGEVPRKKGQ